MKKIVTFENLVKELEQLREKKVRILRGMGLADANWNNLMIERAKNDNKIKEIIEQIEIYKQTKKESHENWDN